MPNTFRRDRLTWVMYVMAGWFAYLQASPGLVVVHLRNELGLSYSVGGFHVAAFAAGATAAGVIAGRLERWLGRRRLLWTAAAVLGTGAIGLAVGRVAEVTVGSVLVMGLGGGLVLVTVQAVLADHHGDLRTIALAEENVVASIAYLALIGVLSASAALQLGWRVALLASLVIPLLAWWTGRGVPVHAPPSTRTVEGRLPGVFWVAAATLFCTTAAEWCVTAWGATFVEDAARMSVDTAVAMMGGYFGGVLIGRIAGSRLARRYQPARLIAFALAVSAAGFAILWPSSAAAPAAVGLFLLGVGLGNLYPMTVALALALAPGQSGLASGRLVAAASFAVVLAPLTVGTLADATSITVALGVVPVMLALAAVGLVLLSRIRTAQSGKPQPAAKTRSCSSSRSKE